jgi:hypothetical protein
VVDNLFLGVIGMYKNCEKNLTELCVKIMDLLDDLKDKNLIDEEEYEKHVYNKKIFFNKVVYKS